MSTDADSSARKEGSGLLHSLRSIGPAALGLLRTRLELLGIELAEERDRSVALVVLGAAAFLFTALALMLVNVLVLAVFWDSHRLAAIAALLVLYAVLAVWCLGTIRIRQASRPPMFESTLAELKADLEALQRVRGE